MPVYEYQCDDCRILFEELHLNLKSAKLYEQQFPCPGCGKLGYRVPSAGSFVFKGVAEGDPTKKSNSGFHDLDYPTLDKVVGRSSNRKWKRYDKEKNEMDKLRRELGTNYLSKDKDGNFVAADENTLNTREKGLRLYRETKDR